MQDKNCKKRGTNKKPKLGFFSFTCCQGCEFTVLFIDQIFDILKNFDVQYFHLLKEKNREVEFDLVFIEGAVTSNREIRKLKEIRKKSKFVVAIGACACHGGIPAMRNFIENKDLLKYVYNQHMLKDSVPAAGIGEHIKVDYYMYGCPIIKEEFIEFVNDFLAGKRKTEFEGTVCDQCPRRGEECYMLQKIPCVGAVTHGGCNALCIRENIPCILCRGPINEQNVAAEAKLFKNWGLSEEEVKTRVGKFKNVELGETGAGK